MVPAKRSGADGSPKDTVPPAEADWRGGAGRRLVALLMLVVLPGCYHYVPVDAETPARGDAIRAQVPGLTVEVGDVAVRAVETVDGEFIGWNGDRLFLSATWLTTQGGRGFDGLHYTVDLERQNVNALLEKRLHTGNTVLMAGAVTAGAVLLHALLQGNLIKAEGPSGPGGPAK
jgi:hypothetical protein